MFHTACIEWFLFLCWYIWCCKDFFLVRAAPPLATAALPTPSAWLGAVEADRIKKKMKKTFNKPAWDMWYRPKYLWNRSLALKFPCIYLATHQKTKKTSSSLKRAVQSQACYEASQGFAWLKQRLLPHHFSKMSMVKHAVKHHKAVHRSSNHFFLTTIAHCAWQSMLSKHKSCKWPNQPLWQHVTSRQVLASATCETIFNKRH